MTQPDPDRASDTLRGTLDKVRFANDEGTWAVADLQVPPPPGRHFGEVITVVGNLMGAWPGEELELKGRWRQHADHGRQFEVAEALTEAPGSPDGMKKYLAHSKVKGVGKVMASRLVDHFGPDTFNIIEMEPQRLLEIDGIGKKRVERISKAWGEKQAERRTKLFLFSHGVSPAYAARIVKVYGDATIERVRKNPYGLSKDIFGIGFKMADVVAGKLGIKGDDPRRVRAGLLQVLREAQSEGHLYLPIEGLVERASDYLGVPRGNISAGIEELQDEDLLVTEPVPEGESDLHPDGHLAIFSRWAHAAEVGCADELSRLLGASGDVLLEVDLQPDALFSEVEGELEVSLAPAQREAIQMAFDHRVLVITGGPGTGKTTLVRAICRTADSLGWRTMLAAPTGRAARRLSEATGHEAATLHRALQFSFKAGGFQHNRDNPLEADLIVVDESSMIDIHLMRALVQAVASGCRLVLVGDVDQLPSVGPGDVLADLIRSSAVPICRLVTVFRQSQESSIIRNAHRINQGELPQPAKVAPGELADFYVIQCEDADAVVRKTLKVVADRIPNAFGLDPVRDVQVLAPMHRGSVGCKNLNEQLQELLNPSFDDEAKRGARVFRVGDRVMQLRNNYDKEVFNGDVGYVSRILRDDDDKVMGMEVDIEGKCVEYDTDDFDEITLAYAVTVHKSQGSEYPAVVIALATQHYVLLERNLLYTALTRARKLAVLVVMNQALSRSVRNIKARARHTRLWRRLQGGTSAPEASDSGDPEYAL